MKWVALREPLPGPGLECGIGSVDVLGVRGIGVTGDGPNDARLRPLRGIRQGGAGLLIMGTVGFSAFFIPGTVASGRILILVADLVAVADGALAVSRLGRVLTGYRSLLMLASASASWHSSMPSGLLTPVPLGIYFVIIFVWVGQWHRPGTALRFAPVGVVAYLLPFTAGAPRSNGEVSSVVLVMTTSVLIAEVLAHQARAAHLAQKEQGRHWPR